MSSPSDQVSPNLWADIRKFVRAKRAEWRARRSRRLRGRERLGQGPRGFGPQAVVIPAPEALEPGFGSLRIWVLLFFLSAVTLLVGVQFGGRFGLVIGFIATLFLNLWLLFLSPTRMLRELISWELEGRDTWGLLEAAREAAQLAHIPAPRVALADRSEFFSLSIGLSSTRSTIILSHGLVEKLSPEERRLLIAFEVAKIACQWTASATAARGLCRLIDWPGFSWLPLIGLRLAMSGGRILKLDEWVASHGESREVWARTLWTLDAMTASKPRRFKPSELALNTVFTSDYLGGGRLRSAAPWSGLTEFRTTRYESSLPSVRTRIGALIDRYPP